MNSVQRGFILDMGLAPGDNVMLSGVVRDIKLQYPEFRVNVVSNFPAIWHHNPHIEKDLKHGTPGVTYMKNFNGQGHVGTHWNEHKIHYAAVLHEEFTKITGYPVHLTKPHGDLHIHPDEKKNAFIDGRYWIIIPGGKKDMTTKIWSQYKYQQVVDQLIPYGLQFVQEGAVKDMCIHPPLNNVLSMVGKTGIRDLIQNIYHAEGVICGITFPMHIAAALNRPCVVLGTMREPPWYEEYSNDWPGSFGSKCEPVKVPHKYLHTMGLLDCCKTGGCGKDRVIPLNDGRKNDQFICTQPRFDDEEQPVPACLDLIQADHVCEAIMSYYEDGYLPPLSASVEELREFRKEKGHG